MPDVDDAPDADEIHRMLDELQRDSQARQTELREIAADLPATMSRRAILGAVAADLRDAPGKGDIVSRALRKLARTPRRAYRAVRHRVRSGWR